MVAVALVAGLLSPFSTRVDAASVPAGFTDTAVFTGLNLPTAIAFAPDGRVFVAEKSGIIKVFPSVSSNSGTVFRDLRAKTYDFNDRGMLGLEVDPRLGNGTGHDFIYVLYAKDAIPGGTTPRWNDNCPSTPGSDTDGCVVTGTLSRIPVNPNGTAGTEQPMIDGEWCQQFSSHSVGHLAFGADGYLYVTGGDGASWVNADWGQFGGSLNNTPTPTNPCGDPPGNAPGVAVSSPTARGGALRSQSPRRPANEPRLLNGALLRVDPDTGNGVPGNPMYNAAAPASNASRIVAHGFRNPFRFTMRPGTSEIWVADVGWGSWEEINRVTAPTVTPVQNFGWPCLERTTRLSGYRDLNMCTALYSDTANPARDPYFAYEHGVPVNGNDTCAVNNGTVISGITFYTGNRYPAAYKNALFFGDNSKNCILVMRAGANGLPDPTTVTTFVDNADNPFPVDLETDPISGDVFYVSIGTGTVHRISYQSSNQAPTAVAGAAPTAGTAPLSVQFNSNGTNDPNGDTLTYTWDTDGNGVYGDASGPSPSVVYQTAGTYNARLRVTDPGGLASTSAAVTITVTNNAAPVNTVAPAISGTPQVGQPLSGTTGTWTGTAPVNYQRQWQRCAATGDYRSAVLADTPNAYWRLGEATGTSAVDERGANNAAYNAGVQLGQSGAVTGNSAIGFDGVDDNVARNPFAGVGTTAITAEFFVSTTDTTKEAGIISYASSGNTDDFQLRDVRNIKVYVRGTTIATGVAVNDGAWHHIAVTWKVGSSRVDLQACKLEYSIVSPK